MCRCCWCVDVPLDLDLFREKLLLLRQMLLSQEEMSKEGRAPVTLEQDSVVRLSRLDAMQVQAMALAQQRRRGSERAAIDAALRRIEQGEFGYCAICGERSTTDPEHFSRQAALLFPAARFNPQSPAHSFGRGGGRLSARQSHLKRLRGGHRRGSRHAGGQADSHSLQWDCVRCVRRRMCPDFISAHQRTIPRTG